MRNKKPEILFIVIPVRDKAESHNDFSGIVHHQFFKEIGNFKESGCYIFPHVSVGGLISGSPVKFEK